MEEAERLEVHKAVREIFRRPDTWIQNWFAATHPDANNPERWRCTAGCTTSIVRDHAGLYKCFCLTGAYYKVTGETDYAVVDELARDHVPMDLDRPLSNAEEMVEWNDQPGRTVIDVLRLLDNTIARMEP